MSKQTRNTYPRSVELATKTMPPDALLGAAIRESVENIRAVGGTSVEIGLIFHNDSRYLFTAHNGLSFEDEQDLNNSLHFNKSVGDSGALGNGLKATAVLLNQGVRPEDSEVIVMSRGTEGFIGGKTQIISPMAYDVSSLSDVDVFGYKTILPYLFEHYNVIYLHRLTGFPEDKPVWDSKTLRTISEMIDDSVIDSFTDGIFIHRQYEQIFDVNNPMKVGTKTKARIGEKPIYQVVSHGSIEAKFITTTADVSTHVELEEPSPYGDDFNVDIVFKSALYFGRRGGDDRCVDLKTGSTDKEHRPTTHKFRVFASICPDVKNSLSSKDCERLERLERDPLYLSKRHPREVWDMSPTVASKDSCEDSKVIEDLWNNIHSDTGLPFPKGKGLNVTKVTRQVSIDVRITARGAAGRSLVTGDYNELFYTQDDSILRQIAGIAISELTKADNPELIRFVSEVEGYFPESQDEFVDLPVGGNPDAKKKELIHIYEVSGRGKKTKAAFTPWKGNKLLTPNTTITVALKHEHRLLEGVLESKDDGVVIKKMKGDGVYKITIDPLYTVDEKDDTMESVSAREYVKHAKKHGRGLVGPSATLAVVTEDDKVLYLRNKIDVPKIPTVKPDDDNNTDTDTDTNIDGRKDAKSVYVSLETPDILGKLVPANKVLLLNTENPRIQTLFRRHGKRTDVMACALYKEMQKAANTSFYASESIEMHYKRGHRYHDSADVEPLDVIIDSGLRIILDTSQYASKIQAKLVSVTEPEENSITPQGMTDVA